MGYRVKEVKELTAESAVDDADGLALIDVRPDFGAIADSSTLAIHTGQGVFKGDLKSKTYIGTMLVKKTSYTTHS